MAHKKETLMAKFNEDGNLFGRIAALVIIAAGLFYANRVYAGFCAADAAQKKTGSCCVTGKS